MKQNRNSSAGTKADSNINADVTTSSQTIAKPHVSSISCLGERENELANKWIKELSDAGYTPDEMIAVFREARRKYDDYKKRMSQLKSKK